MLFVLGYPPIDDVVEGDPADEGEGYNDNIHTVIGKDSKPFIVFLACCVPKSQFKCLSFMFNLTN